MITKLLPSDGGLAEVKLIWEGSTQFLISVPIPETTMLVGAFVNQGPEDWPPFSSLEVGSGMKQNSVVISSAILALWLD